MDRDGVINRITPGNYIRHISEFKLLPNVKSSLAKLTRAGYEIHIISNQQGVAKGLMTRSQLSEITQLLLERLEKSGVKINSVNYCTHWESENCDCRKPNTGLFLQAVEDRKINFRETWMIGDSWRDMKAGKTLGCKTIFIGNSDFQTGKKIITESHEISPDYMVKNLSQAVNLVLKSERHSPSVEG